MYVVDRLKTEVITSAITHFQHVAVLQSRRHIVKRIINRHKVKHPDQPKVRMLLLCVHDMLAYFCSSSSVSSSSFCSSLLHLYVCCSAAAAAAAIFIAVTIAGCCKC